MVENFNPSGVEIEKAELISYDGKTRTDIGSGNYIYGWSISQSMLIGIHIVVFKEVWICKKVSILST